MNELENVNNVDVENLYNKISRKIEDSKRNVALQANREITILYWNIGKDIKENVLNHKKAEYGKYVIKELSEKLIIKYGRGYSKQNIFRMLKFYEYFQNFEKVSIMSAILSWSHIV